MAAPMKALTVIFKVYRRTSILRQELVSADYYRMKAYNFHSLQRLTKEISNFLKASNTVRPFMCQRCYLSLNSNRLISTTRRNLVPVDNLYKCSKTKPVVETLTYGAQPYLNTQSLYTSHQPRRTYHQKRGGNKNTPYEAIDDLANPIDRLQSFVDKPILSEEKYIFKPTEENIRSAQKLFTPGHGNKIEFLKSALMEEHLPVYDLPEVAFIGRSNVGKSSLISTLLSQTDVVVRTSKTPGHTKLLNFFQIGKHFTLVDMPGYGFNMPKHYSGSVETFLASRKKLHRTIMIIDGVDGVTKHDVTCFNMLEEFQIPYVITFLLMEGKLGPTKVDELRFEIIKSLNIDFCIVLTKIDKAKPTVLLKNFMTALKYQDQTTHCFLQPFLVSSMTGEGIPQLQTFIAYVTGNIAVDGM